MKKQKGRFITIEGSEGVGKTTNIKFIQSYLAEHNITLLTTREPGGTPLAEEIRQLLLAKRGEEVDSTAELLLMFAARSQHLKTVILPAIQSGTWVLCDRFTDSTYAYQGGGRRMDVSPILALEDIVQDGLQPDITLYLDIDVKVGLERAGKRSELDRFEAEQIDFFERVRAAYLSRVEAYPERFRVVNAEKPLEQVQADIAKILSALLDETA